MPTLNIDVNARTERAKKDLRALDREILRLSDSEEILSKSLAQSGDVGAKAFKRISSAAVRQAKAVNSAAGQFRQLRSQLQAAGAAPQVIGRLTTEFIKFRGVMEGGTVASRKFQQTQDKFSTTLRTTARQFKLLTGEVRDSTSATAKLNAQNKANQTALARQAHALSNAKIQYKQLLAQMRRLGASKSAIRSTTQAFVEFRKEMNTARLSSIQLQKAQDKLKTSFSGTTRQLAATTAATRKAGSAAGKSRKSVTGLGHTLENLGSTAVLVAGPLSGVGSRLIAFGAIAKRGSLAVAGLFSSIAGGAVLIFKGINAFDKLNLSLAKTEAILKATGKEARITSKFVEEVASRIARTTLANLEDTRPVAASLLSFRGVDEENLESILSLSQDISSTGITDLANAAKLLGRTLEDPIANMDALRRVFVQLTPLQKDQVTHLQNIGKGAEAAGIIFDVLKDKVGGVGQSQNTGLAGAVDRLGQSWTHFLEDLGGNPAHKFAVNSIHEITDLLEKLTRLRIKLRSMTANFMSGLRKTIADSLSSIADMGKDGDDLVGKIIGPILRGLNQLIGADKPPKDDSDIDGPSTGRGFPKGPKMIPLKPVPPSRLSKALIDVNTGIKRSFVDLDAEREKLQQGFSSMSPEILKLNEKYKGFDDIVKILAGDFGELYDESLKIATQLKETNDALLDLGRRKEAAAIFKETRTTLEKYNDELKRLIFLHDNNYISTSSFIRKQEELRATLKSSIPELDALTSASERFGDSLADLIVKGEDFAEGLKAVFKSLVDDILKQFLKLSVVNPILNSIFGASSGRPEFGSQGGLSGSEGFLGRLMGGTADDDSPQKALSKVTTDFGEAGSKEAQKYGEVLNKTNVKMGEAGAKAANDFGGIFSSATSGLASGVGAGIGSFLGHKAADLLGLQHGGSFKVGGSGGRDSQLVAFKASPRERVSVETPGQQKKNGSGNVTYIDARGVDPGQMNRLIKVVEDLDASVEVRAVSAAADARDRNPSLFGRTL